MNNQNYNNNNQYNQTPYNQNQPNQNNYNPNQYNQPNYNQQNYNPNQNNMNVSNNQNPEIKVIVHQDIKLFKTTPVVATCPTCKQSGVTTVDTQFSWGNYCCYFLTSPLAWIIFQCCRDKAYSCNDATHFCFSCGSQIFRYEAC